ncbi:imelysin family protein [Limibacterium fermenti]|uniref:imelysin family protein n=1 Tax=Limibacterium fermenti TaxID=3229863 RepID=UPI000E8241A5|nr:peptidase M75 [Porphyromonadaceae bacterium]
MNKNFKFSILAFALIALGCNFSACEKEIDVVDTSNSDELKAINKQYVEKVVLPTYASLADATIDLHAAIVALKNNKTEANLNIVANKWTSTRVYWEESEAFLFGPVDELGIDPHIDTWPLGVNAFNDLIKNADFIQRINNENGDKIISSVENKDGVLGFHSLEYIIFRNGTVRNINDITETELIFAVAVAGDLRNQCSLIEVGWLGESGVSSDKLNYAKRADNYSLLGTTAQTEYAKKMLETPNGLFTSALSSTSTILDGCIDIADEVGAMKLGKPYNGASDEDKNYIESQYSYNSKVDFAGNVRSIENAYLGGIPTKRSVSVSDYVKSKDATLDTQVKEAIINAIAKIDAMQDFEINAQSNSTKEAMEACLDLNELLEKAKTAIKN